MTAKIPPKESLRDIQQHREEILSIAKKHGVTSIKVFGSVARGEENEKSDIDFLIEMERDRSLMDLGGLVADLEDLLHRKVDVVEPDGLHYIIRDGVLKDAIPV